MANPDTLTLMANRGQPTILRVTILLSELVIKRHFVVTDWSL
jgi:hypothetical protein